MQIAEVLSDLTSLRVCDPAAALALVSATTTGPTTSPANESSSKTTTGGETAATPGSNDSGKDAGKKEDADDVDLQRARDMLALRAVFKNENGGSSLAAELAQWREEVRERMMAIAGDGGFAGVMAGTESDEEARQGGEGEGEEEDEGFEDWA